jgi:hypothetical protein
MGRVVRSGMGLAVLAISLLSAGCFASGPPPAPASLAVGPSPVNFPTTPPPYWPMPIVQVTVTNTGGRPARSLAVNGVGVYSVIRPSAEPNACFGPTPLAALTPGQSCVVDVQFCPTAPGPYQNTLVVNGQDSTSGASLQATTTLNGTAS